MLQVGAAMFPDACLVLPSLRRAVCRMTLLCFHCSCCKSALAKERRELQQQQQRTLLEAIPKDLSRPWEDPMPEEGERHLAAVRRGSGRPHLTQWSAYAWRA